MMCINSQAGVVYWLTGLSGAGKTTVGKALFQRLKERGVNVVFLDGDTLREVFGSDLGHSRDQRLISAMRNSRICKFLADQGLSVVCATVSMFHDCQKWNRENIPGYKEIYINPPLEVLFKRDQKQLYSRALRGETENVVGLDLKAEEPLAPDLTVNNNGTHSPEDVAEFILESICSTTLCSSNLSTIKG